MKAEKVKKKMESFKKMEIFHENWKDLEKLKSSKRKKTIQHKWKSFYEYEKIYFSMETFLFCEKLVIFVKVYRRSLYKL